MPFANNPDDGVRIYYEVEGSGPPLLLAHGATMNLTRWRSSGYDVEFRDEYQVIMIDARGHGRSEKPHDPHSYVISKHVSDVITVLDELAIENAHYCGYSMGGRTGYFLGRFAPDRVRSLIIMGSNPLPRSPAENPGADYQNGMGAYIENLERNAGALAPEIKASMLANDGQALVAAAQGNEIRPRPESGRFGNLGMPSQREGLSIADDLSLMTMPCLIIAGDREPGYPEAQLTTEALPNARFVALKGYGHVGLMMHTDLLFPELHEFLRAIESGVA